MLLVWSVTGLFIFIISVGIANRLTAGSSDSPPNITELRAKDTWNLEVRWTAKGTPNYHFQGYEVQIGLNENFTVVDQKNVSKGAEAGDPFYTWVWTSALPLNCADHSVRVRRVFNSSLASSWSEWTTNHGQQGVSSPETRLFPKEVVLREGVPAVFCCIPADGANVTTMKLGNNGQYPLSQVGGRVRSIWVAALNSTQFGVNFICQDDSGSKNNVLNYVTFPPERPQNLSCESSDLRRVVCSWIYGRELNLSKSRRRQYTLHFQSSDGVHRAVPCYKSRCTFNIVPEQSFYNISVVVRNALGEERETYAFNISDRVFPVAEDVSVLVGVTDAEVSWALSGNFTGLHFSCRIRLDSAEGQDLQVVDAEWEWRLAVRLQHLRPSSQYSVTVCCGLRGRSCGPAATPTNFSTDPLVLLDVWRKIEGQDHNRSVTVLWKTLNSGPDSSIQMFEVCVEQQDGLKRVCKNVTQMRADVTMGPGVCHVTVRTVTGSSASARITVPATLVPGEEERCQEKRIMGNAEGFLLSWPNVSSATCGYNVEWCMMGSAAPCDLQWSKVPANQTSLFLTADGFRRGCRYTFRIFSCHTEGDRVHEKHVGYLEEQSPLQCPELHHSPSVSWTSVKLEWTFNEEDPTHPGFITGYRITVHNDSHWNSAHNMWSISVDRPDCKRLEVAGLQENQQYTIRLAACTRAGCGTTTIQTITTLPNRYLLLAKVLTPLLVLIGCFICLWPCRKTLKGIAGDVFSFPSDHTVKVLELDSSLYEVSEKLRGLRVEECECCDLEILEADLRLLLPNSSNRQMSSLTPAAPPLTEHSPAQSRTAVEEASVRGDPGDETVTSVMNLTYLPSPLFLQPPPGAPELTSTEPPGRASWDTAPSAGYVTPLTMVTM